MIKWTQSRNDKEVPTSKRQRFSRDDSRNEVIRTLMSKTVAKELGEMKLKRKKKLKGRSFRLNRITIS